MEIIKHLVENQEFLFERLVELEFLCAKMSENLINIASYLNILNERLELINNTDGSQNESIGLLIQRLEDHRCVKIVQSLN